MPDYEFDPRFEQGLEQRLRAYAEEGRRPFDALEIAHRAATGEPAGYRPVPARGRSWLPAPLMAALLTGLLVVALAATAFAAGWLRLPVPIEEPSPSPAPSPTQLASPAPPTEPAPATPEPPVSPPPSPSPSPSPSPNVETPSPQITPTSEPTPPATPAPAVPGSWLRVTIPTADGFVRLRDVTAGGPGFVAVGFVSDGAGNVSGGLSWTSPDGLNWTAGSGDAFAGARLEIVVEHQGSLYAFGPIPTDDEDFPDRGAYNVWRSDDGLAWEQLPQPAVFANDAVLQGATSAGNVLVAYGSHNSVGAPSALPGIWLWEAGSGEDWQPAQTLPQTYDVSRVAYARGSLIALGNSTSDEAPWRSLWVSGDGGRNWQQAAAPLVSDMEDVAAIPGRWIAVGWQSRGRQEVVPGVVASPDGLNWTGGELEQLAMQRMERVVAIPGGFLALGSEVRFEVDPNCAPGPCEDLVPVGARTWTSADGLSWQPASDPPDAVAWTFAGIGAGPAGVVVVGNDEEFEHGIWFAPLAPSTP